MGDLLAKARTSPEGENPTECTHPPELLEYSPHTVLNGSFSPHTEGAGLARLLRSHTHAHERHSLLVDVLDIGRKDTSLHIRASCSEQDVVWVPVDRKNGRSDWFLELLRNPPIIVFVKRANGNCPKQSWMKLISDNDERAHLAPLATANLSSNGLQRTKVAARLIRNRTRVGFQTVTPVRGSGACCQT